MTDILLPDVPVLIPGHETVTVLSTDGELSRLPLREGRKFCSAVPLVCHGRQAAVRLNVAPFPAHDLLELFAFVYPARFCLPTPAGLADALGLPRPADSEAAPAVMLDAAARLLEIPGQSSRTEKKHMAAIVRGMAGGDWPWAPFVLDALQEEAKQPKSPFEGLAVWHRLKEWEETAPPPPPASHPVSAEEARERLHALLAHEVGEKAEDRPQQADYASAMTHAFQPAAGEAPATVMAEAGTGIGKTLGYLAPALLWAEKNRGSVWISTYTRNLQRQIQTTLEHLAETAGERRTRIAVRKGRENYLCLLNLEDAVRRALGAKDRGLVSAGLLARWAEASADGALIGSDLPGWLVDLFGPSATLALSDHRGECIYSACPHYRSCFIEHALRRARKADIVVANHALVMVQAALGGLDGENQPGRYVFDEGHHLFSAADSAFSLEISGLETAQMRRWLRGSERRSGRSRGLKSRAEDLVAGDDTGVEALADCLDAARQLPGPGWDTRIAGGMPRGAGERFLGEIHAFVRARAGNPDSPHDLECGPEALPEALLEAADDFQARLAGLHQPAKRLKTVLEERLDVEAGELATEERRRLEAVSRSLTQRVENPLSGWRAMLKDLHTETPAEMVDGFTIRRQEGRDTDVAMFRHWIDPTRPFATVFGRMADGLGITSASLRDRTGDVETDWNVAAGRTGVAHLAGKPGAEPPLRAAFASPFSYGKNTRVFIITDIPREATEKVAAAYRELFLAGGGGGLGIFTAISRLKAVRARIAADLEEGGLPLLAQHVDGMDTATLVNIFRTEEKTCLLGTDAVRDGVDVPGPSLKLTVFDRVPWPRPDILHRARREHFGRRRYEDMLTRLKLSQAFGRLIRTDQDRGVFVLLDPLMPSRLLGAFPETTPVKRAGLAEALEEIRGFLRE